MLTLCIVCLDYVTVISQSITFPLSMVIISCTHCKFSHALLRNRKWTLLKNYVVVESLIIVYWLFVSRDRF